MPPVTHTPTAQEQMLLEYLNLLRQDPGGEFDRLVTDPGRGTGAQRNITEAMVYFGVSIDALRSQLGSFAAVSPLAWNGALALSSERHTQLMIAADLQSHLLPGEADLGARITAAGYTRWTRLGENVYAHTHDPLYTHAGFVIDWGKTRAICRMAGWSRGGKAGAMAFRIRQGTGSPCLTPVLPKWAWRCWRKTTRQQRWARFW